MIEVEVGGEDKQKRLLDFEIEIIIKKSRVDSD
jgi:hypothetical protein